MADDKDSFDAEKSVNLKKSSLFLDTFKKGAALGVSVLNGVVGDYLQSQKNELAIVQQFYLNGKPVSLTSAGLRSAFPQASERLCILVHGLSCNESIWNFPNAEGLETTFGTLLQADLGYTIIYLRYNSGLHISENGQLFSELLESLVKNYPRPLTELTLLAHSMGGLVSRSAIYYAEKQQAEWIKKLHNVLLLGSPHLGSYWEKLGNVVSWTMNAVPRPYMKLASQVANLRSAGIKDLRYGNIAEEDWQGHNPDALLKNTKQTIPLVEGVNYYVISGSLTSDPTHPIAQWFGDALVSRNSATGRASEEKHFIPFPAENHREFPQLDHLRMVHSLEVYAQIKTWCEIGQDRVLQTKAENFVAQAEIKEQANFVVEEELGSNQTAANADLEVLQDQPLATRQQLKGLLTLVHTAVDQGATAVEKVQESLTAENYSVLNKVPLVSTVSQLIQSAQATTTRTVYNTVRLVNDGVEEVAKVLILEEDKKP